MTISRCIIVSLLCTLLAGCLSVPPHSLSDADLHAYKLVDVTVEGVEVIRSWPSEEDRFVATHAVDLEMANRIRTEPAFAFPELRSHFQQTLDRRIRDELTYLAGPILSGNRPARIIVRLRVFDIPSVARRVFIDQNTKIQADIDLVDKASGALVLRYHGRLVSRQLIGGLATGIAVVFEGSDLGYGMISDYLSGYRNWLLRN